MTNEMNVIRGRIEAELYGGGADNPGHTGTDGDRSDSLIAGEYPFTYKWADIEYAPGDRTVWESVTHLRRILSAVSCAGPGRLRSDAAFRERITGALRFWTVLDLKNPNWWYNEIGAPMLLADIVMLTSEYLPEELLSKAVTMIRRGVLGFNEKVNSRTGANLVWGASITVKLALITDDEKLLREASARLSDELVCGREGIQPDGSFFQHGPRLYSGGYGRSFADDMSAVCLIFTGTSYMFPAEKLSLFVSFILDGLRFMTHLDALDYQVVGREYTRCGMIGVRTLPRDIKRLLSCAEMPRRDELEAYYRSMTERLPFTGTKYFPAGAMLCHHTGGLYVGSKILTPDTLDEEICNGEGVLGFNMSYGSHLCVMKTGREYLNMPAVWKYDRIPGTTCADETDAELLAHDVSWSKRPLPNSDCGGGTCGEAVCVHEKAEHDGICAYVADFAFEGGFARLVCGIEDEKNRPLHTTVQQCGYEGGVSLENGSLICGGIRYTPLGGTVFSYTAVKASGAWSRGNPSESPETVTEDVLTVTVNHPAGEISSCAFAYSDADAPVPCVTVLSNTVSEQSVRLGDGRILRVRRDNI